jgi:hypothetical protein
VSVEIEHPRADGDVRHAGGGTEAMFPEHILTVRATVEPAHEEEFNRWYTRNTSQTC